MSWFLTRTLPRYVLALTFFYLNLIDADVFLVRPGGGDIFVYSPININATLHCVVNDTVAYWTVGRLSFFSRSEEAILNAEGIFQMTDTVSDGILSSNLTVYGNITLNNDSFICCVSSNSDDSSCTTLIVYDHPPPPNNIMLQHTGMMDSLIVNISWTVTTMKGVNQTYKITFDSETIIKTVTPYYVYKQSLFGIKCVAYVQAVNGAGESDPSNNVTIPSLPDIEPVTASLTHQVWKSNGHIMVNVSFEEAQYCESYPVLAYNVTLRPQTVGKPVEVSINGNQTEVVLGPEDGVKHDHKYLLSVTAINMIGNASFDMSKVVVTSDLQAVNVSLVNEFAINVQCMFIMGSDSLGCSVLLISNQSGVESVNATLSKKQRATYASGQVSPTHKSHCYDRVLAYNIDKHSMISNFSVETELPWRTNIRCSAIAQFPAVTVVASTIPVAIIVIIITVTVIAVLVVKLKAVNAGKQVSASSRLDCEAHEISQTELDSKIQCSTLQHDDFSLSPPLLDTGQKTVDKKQSLSSALPDNKESKDTATDDPPSPHKIPIYALPDKLKKKNVSSDGQSSDKQQKTNKSGSHDHDDDKAQAHIYHMLENTKGQDTTNADPKDCSEAMYSLPDKTRLKPKSLREDCVASPPKNASESGNSQEQEDSQQDHIYHVLEQSEVPDAVPLSPSHDAPQLPSPFDPDNFTPTPVYQDITELQTK